MFQSAWKNFQMIKSHQSVEDIFDGSQPRDVRGNGLPSGLLGKSTTWLSLQATWDAVRVEALGAGVALALCGWYAGRVCLAGFGPAFPRAHRRQGGRRRGRRGESGQRRGRERKRSVQSVFRTLVCLMRFCACAVSSESWERVE